MNTHTVSYVQFNVPTELVKCVPSLQLKRSASAVMRAATYAELMDGKTQSFANMACFNRLYVSLSCNACIQLTSELEQLLYGN